MPLQVDFFFSYKNVSRYMLIQKYGLFLNSYQIPYIRSLIVFFGIFNLIDYDDVRAFNYAYFIGFFFGRRAFFTKASSVFHLNVTYFSYKVFCVFYFQDIFYPLFFFVNDVLAYSYKDFYSFKCSWNGLFFYFKFSDMNIFIEKKSNLGFYNLKDPLRFKLLFSGILF